MNFSENHLKSHIIYAQITFEVESTFLTFIYTIENIAIPKIS